MEDNNMQDIEELLESMEQENKDEVLSKKKVEKSLKERQTEILKKLKDYRRKNGVDILWFVIWCMIFGGDIYVKNNIWTEGTLLRTITYYFFIIVSFIGILYKLNDISKNRKMKIDSRFDLSIIEDDIFLEEIKGLSQEEKALKQLSKKQVDIERYHSLNLAHTKSIFVIGVFIIFIGIAIIIATIVFILFVQKSAQLIVIISGFIGGLMVDSVGAIFILMYSKTIESAQEYQDNMVKTANTYLGNVLVSQITNSELREETLSAMAKDLVQRSKNAE